MPHPATMFLLLTVAVIFLSWIFDIYGLSVVNPADGAEIRVQSLLSPEGIRWLLRHVVTNFTGFAPLGMVMVTLFGVGVAEHSGFINACIRLGLRDRMNRRFAVGHSAGHYLQRGGRCGIYYADSDSCHALSVGGDASHCRDCDCLCICGMRL